MERKWWNATNGINKKITQGTITLNLTEKAKKTCKHRARVCNGVQSMQFTVKGCAQKKIR